MKNKPTKGAENVAGPGSVRIAFSSAGKDFHLEVRGGKLDDCERTFERLFNKVKTAHAPEASHYG